MADHSMGMARALRVLYLWMPRSRRGEGAAFVALLRVRNDIAQVISGSVDLEVEAPAPLVVILSEAKNLSVVLRMG
jgi:hypothetical protein